MSQFLEQDQLSDDTLHLEEEEKKHPLIVLERFFTDYRLNEFRHHLWEMVETCLTTLNVEFNEPEARADLLLHYRDLQRVLEAGLLLLRQKCAQAKPENNPSH